MGAKNDQINIQENIKRQGEVIMKISLQMRVFISTQIKMLSNRNQVQTALVSKTCQE